MDKFVSSSYCSAKIYEKALKSSSDYVLINKLIGLCWTAKGNGYSDSNDNIAYSTNVALFDG